MRGTITRPLGNTLISPDSGHRTHHHRTHPNGWCLKNPLAPLSQRLVSQIIFKKFMEFSLCVAMLPSLLVCRFWICPWCDVWVFFILFSLITWNPLTSVSILRVGGLIVWTPGMVWDDALMEKFNLALPWLIVRLLSLYRTKSDMQSTVYPRSDRETTLKENAHLFLSIALPSDRESGKDNTYAFNY